MKVHRLAFENVARLTLCDLQGVRLVGDWQSSAKATPHREDPTGTVPHVRALHRQRKGPSRGLS